jgi:SAM-dependent methyltransferase
MNPHAAIELSVIIMAAQETVSLETLLTTTSEELTILALSHEIIVISRKLDNDTQDVIQKVGARLITSPQETYGEGLMLGFQHANGEYILVMDADHDKAVDFIRKLWQARFQADILIASRYCRGGQAKMPLLRLILSKGLNLVFSRGLDLQVRDMSSGFRLYRSAVLQELSLECRGYDILQEILVKAMMEGYRICEIPFVYSPQKSWSAYERVLQFGLLYGKTYARLWRFRNSISSADYDARAYDAFMPPQRYWQRQRYKQITKLARGQGICLDVGCGSSRILGTLPKGSIALDILIRKLRYARTYGISTIQGSISNLPLPAGTFPCIICSQVIEHVPRQRALNELDRVLAPGGLLILGTPDYAKWQWRVIEWFYKHILPQAYADEHITHYTANELNDEFVNQRGYKSESVYYILQGELILGLRKPDLGKLD